MMASKEACAMSSPDMIREVLGIVRVQSGRSIADLVRKLTERDRQTGHDWSSLALEAVATLVRWRLVEVRDERQRLALDEVEKISRYQSLDDFELSITPEAAEMASQLGLRLDGGLPSVFGIPKRPDQPPDVFVVMPFAVEMDSVFTRIKSVGESLGLKVERGDEAFTANVVMEDVWSSISFARLVVADCTGRNANVFYEIGLAHAIGKITIPVSQKIADIPFDIGHRRVIVYEATPEGMDQFAEKLKATIRSELAV